MSRWRAIGVVAVLLVAATWMGPGAAFSAQCPVPLHVRVGDIDADFEFDRDTVRDAANEAALAWQAAASEPLFVESDEVRALVVNLRYDERQAETDATRALREAFDAERRELEDRQAELMERNDEIQAAFEAHNRHIAAFNARAEAHEEAIGAFNAGGGPQSRAAEQALRTERDALNREREQIEQTGEALRHAQDEHNLEVRSLQADQQAFNRRAKEASAELAGRPPFVAGTYTGSRFGDRTIDVYHAGSYEDLVTVLAHELGHALGIGHVADPQALMTETRHTEATGRAVQLTEADREALQAACGHRF